MKRFLIIFALFFCSISLSAQSDTSKKKKEFIEVAFLSNGTLLVDGKLSSKKALIPKLEALQKKKGEVHYYQARTVKQKDLMRAIDLMKLVKKYKLPMIAYKDKNFSKRQGQ